MSRLVLQQHNNSNHKKYFCQCCLYGCIREAVLKNHLHLSCFQKLTSRRRMTKSSFKNRITTTQLVIYANFKSILYQQDSCQPWSSNFFTIQYQHHVPCRSCIYVKCSDGWYFEAPEVNIGDDSAKMFLEQLLPAATFCRQHLPNKIPMKRLT